MRQESSRAEIAIGVPRPIVISRSLASATRRMIAIAFLRVTFGLIWAVDAALRWQPAFQANFSQIASGVAQGEPSFLNWWFSTWQFIVGGRAPIFAVLTASTETYLAFALITGFARKLTYSLGIVYGLFVWSVAEGFRGPYGPGATTDVGTAVIYSLLFWALLLVDAGRMSVDRLIAARAPAWRRISG